jgi:hypothetical protein
MKLIVATDAFAGSGMTCITPYPYNRGVILLVSPLPGELSPPSGVLKREHPSNANAQRKPHEP